MKSNSFCQSQRKEKDRVNRGSISIREPLSFSFIQELINFALHVQSSFFFPVSPWFMILNIHPRRDHHWIEKQFLFFFTPLHRSIVLKSSTLFLYFNISHSSIQMLLLWRLLIIKQKSLFPFNEDAGIFRQKYPENCIASSVSNGNIYHLPSNPSVIRSLPIIRHLPLSLSKSFPFFSFFFVSHWHDNQVENSLSLSSSLFLFHSMKKQRRQSINEALEEKHKFQLSWKG